MARCMLCASPVGEHDATCPYCGGAVDVEGVDGSTVVGGPVSGPVAPPLVGAEDPTRIQEPAGYVPGAFGVPPGDSFSAFAAQQPEGPAPAAPPAPAPAPVGPVGPDGPVSGPFPAPAAAWPPPAPGGSAPGAAPGYGPAPAYGTPGYGSPGYGSPGYGYGQWPAPAPYVPPRRNDSLALPALLCSVLGLVLALSCGIPVLACPVGAILGHRSLRRIATTGDNGRGLALTGIIAGWIGTGLLVIGLGFLVAVLVAA